MIQEFAFDKEVVGFALHSFTTKVFQMPINAFIVNWNWEWFQKNLENS
jgi:hypothetical protein